ncbi:hypothetical protein ACGF0K_36155 [Streptomyces sp. NPDC048156]|uniref:hypothetical protein n=1 Tax=Streptomyces sp. NPDC048156 TaxID=3365502 RepID=UPI0037142605
MRLTLTRILLSPVTSCRAAWATARSAGRLSFDAAWRQERVARHPDELVYRQHGHHPPHSAAPEQDAEAAPRHPKTEPGPAKEI